VAVETDGDVLGSVCAHTVERIIPVNPVIGLDDGGMECTACGQSTYKTDVGIGTCSLCPANSESSFGNSHCLCSPGYGQTSNTAPCIACENCMSFVSFDMGLIVERINFRSYPSMEAVLIMMQNTLAMHVGIPSSSIVFGTNKDLGASHIAIPVNVTMSTGHVTKFISDISKDDFNILFEHVPFDPALRDSGQPFTSQDTDEATIITLTPNTPAPIASTRAVTFKATEYLLGGSSKCSKCSEIGRVNWKH
jgi:hypothetical protein